MTGQLPKKAKVLKYDKHGKASEVLQLAEQDLPEVGDSQVAVKMLASSVNPSCALCMYWFAVPACERCFAAHECTHC